MSGSALGAMKFLPVSVEGLNWRGGDGALRPPRAHLPHETLGLSVVFPQTRTTAS